MNSDSVKMQQDMSLMMRMIAKEVREASFDEIQDGVDILDCGGIQFVKNDTDLTYKGVQLVNGWVGSFQSTKIVSNQSVRVDVELNTATDISKISADFFTRN